ncbi:carbohydrate sulfotransferase 11-like isoform X2 [Asterias amurensis]|uniref:carbohydrate sulfotransferase 11-like isoform X2 n=1 Tax=Asterias amurensis TaxID=7602 RepID=UPI003AB9083F
MVLEKTAPPIDTTMALKLLRDLKDLRLSLLFVIVFAAFSTCYISISYSKTSHHQQRYYYHMGERDQKRSVANSPEIKGNKVNDNIKHNNRPTTLQIQASNVHNVSDTAVTTTAKTQQPTFSFETKEIQLHRKKHMDRMCHSKYHIETLDFGSQKPIEVQAFKYLLDLSYVNDDYKIIVTTIHKVGSSNWRRFMQDLHKISSDKFRKAWPPLKFLSKRPTVEIQQNLKEYTKVLFVRHPLVRLLSAYRDKFVKLPTSHYVGAAVKIIKIIRKQSPANLKKPDMTFTEFLTYLDGAKNGQRFDSHWALTFEKYKPCHVRYDVIGKLETLLPDVDYLTDKLGVKGRVEYRYPKPYSGSSNTSLLIENYSKVPPELVRSICQIYHDDFIAFDYALPKNFSDLAEYLTKIG